MPKPILLSTTDKIYGHEIIEHIGVVYGEESRGKGWFKSAKDAVLEKIHNYQAGVLKARKASELEIIKRARKVKADAIVGLDMQITHDGEVYIVTMLGTAVKLKKTKSR